MSGQLLGARIAASAFLYDKMRDLPEWFRKLTPRQVENIADLMVQWHLPGESNRIVPMEEVERREVLQALIICHGDVLKAAKALKIGKTTIYRKLGEWGFIWKGQLLLAQASVLGDRDQSYRRRLSNGTRVPSDQPVSPSR